MAPVRTLALCVGLLSSAALAGPKVLLFPAVGTTTRVVIAGRVLQHASSGGDSALGKNLRRLASSNWEGASVEVRFSGLSSTVKSGHDGNFEVALEAPAGHPFEVGLTTAEGHVTGADTGIATVDVLSPQAPFVVISDFDDTVAVTNVLQTRKMVEAGLFEDETTQPAVPGMAAFYGCLRPAGAQKPGFQFVSGSPAQYSGRVGAFLTRNGFPAGAGLALRDVGPKTLHDYKQPIIRAFAARVPGPLVMVGDSGEKDPEIYLQMRAELGERVKAVFIRDVGRDEDAQRFKGLVLFHQPVEAAREAVKLGLADAACVEAAFAPSPDAGAVDGGKRP